MSLNHGVNTYKSDTKFSAVKEAGVGIPFYIGCWPCHLGEGYKGKPQIAYNFSEAEELGGYSEEWRDNSGAPKWSLCQAMYSHFKLFGMSPAIFYNMFDPATHKAAVAGASFTFTDHMTTLPVDALNSGITVSDGTDTLVAGTDYETFFEDGRLVVALKSASEHYSATSLTVAYDQVSLSAITSSTVEAAVEKIEQCKSLFGIVPDLICAPGWSSTPSVAAVMAAKAGTINGLFRGKAVVDLDTSSSGADDYSDVYNYKSANGYTDEDMIVCWPLMKVGTYLFDASVLTCGKIAEVDQGNGDCPYESPSNKNLPITGCVNKAGAEINLTVQQADAVTYSAGVVTAINFNGWVLWGNYTGCWPASTDVSKYFICTNRTMDWICNTFVNTYWSYVDKPLTRVTIDAIVNSFNSWLNGLTHDNKLYGGEIKYIAENNPTASLIGGKFRLDTVMASPVPAQEIDMYVEYDVDILTEALNG